MLFSLSSILVEKFLNSSGYSFIKTDCNFFVDSDGIGFFVHPLDPKPRIRFTDEVAKEGKNAKKSYLRDVFGSYSICIGVST